MSCCDFDCRQGRDCPVRAANSFPHVTGCSTKSPPAHTAHAQAAIESVAKITTSTLLWLLACACAAPMGWLVVRLATQF